MRLIYSFVMVLLTPYLLFRLWWKGRHLPLYRKRILERFCLDKKGTHQVVDVWIHAVSLGEVIAATPLINRLLDNNHSILVTTMTPTGSEHVQTKFKAAVMHQYLPYDLPFVLKRFYKRYQIKMGILMETELWPNLIYQAHAAKIPLVLANARLSLRSLKGYLKFKFLFGPILRQLTAIYSQSEEDAKRFLALGADKAQIEVLGNMKFDLLIHPSKGEQFLEMQTRWGKNRIVFIAASTHDNEEFQILNQLKGLQQAIPKLLLLIAPRHPERFKTVYQLAIQSGFKTSLRSMPHLISKETEVVILDSLGELLNFYELSDYAFVGGSLVPVGGHNVLEPIAMNVPVISGNYVHNFSTICKELMEQQAMLLVQGGDELAAAIIKLYENKEFLKQMTQNASLVFKNNQGSVKRHLDKIESIIAGPLVT